MYKAHALAILLSATTPAFAADWSVTNLNLAYDNGHGSAKVDHASFVLHEGEDPLNFNNAVFDVRWGADQLVIENPAENFSYAIEAPFLRDIHTAATRGFGFVMTPGKVSIAFSSATLVDAKSTTQVGKTSLQCASAAMEADPVDACLVSTRFNLASYAQDNNRGTGVSDAQVSINKGSLNFTVKIDGIGKLVGVGSATHAPGSSSLKIKINSVKYGILGVTGQFFDQLEKNESDTFQVNRPYITINYGNQHP